jgi:hypothetical protein
MRVVNSAYASGLPAMGAQSEARFRRAARFLAIGFEQRLLGATVAEPHTLSLGVMVLRKINGNRRTIPEKPSLLEKVL